MRPALTWLVCSGLSIAALGAAAPRLVFNKERRHHAEHELDRAALLLQELRSVQGARPASVAAPSGLQPRLAEVLASAALPASVLQSLAPEPRSGRVSSGGTRTEHRRATAVLQNLTLANLGAFLDAWRRAEPGWVITGIELTQAGSAPPGTDLPVRASLVLEHTSVALGPASAMPLDALTKRSPP